MTVGELHWIAGWLEGEGCFTPAYNSNKIYKPGNIRLSAASTDLDTLQLARQIITFGTIYLIKTNYKKSGEPCKTCWSYRLGGHRAALLMADIYPFMSQRRRLQIDEVLLHYTPTEVRRVNTLPSKPMLKLPDILPSNLRDYMRHHGYALDNMEEV